MPIPFINQTVKPSVKKLHRDLAYFFPELTHFYGGGSTPDHVYQRCLDAMVYDSSGDYVAQQGRKNLPYSERIKLGDRVAAFLIRNARHYHLNGIIWNRRVMGFPGAGQTGNYVGPYGTWRPYKHAAHDDHLHIDQDGRDFASLIPDALGTVWMDRLVPGVTDSDSVRLVQRALNIPQSGAYDDATVAAVKAFQASLGDAPQYQDGLLGPKQAAELFRRAGLNVIIRTDPSGPPPPPPPPPVVTTYWVDPSKVDTVLLGIDRPGGRDAVKRAEKRPRDPIAVARIVTGGDGRKWAVTEDGTHYALAYLTDKEPPPPPKEESVNVVWLNSNVMREDDKRSPIAGRANGLAKLYTGSGASLFTWQEVDPHVTARGPLTGIVAAMGSRFWYDRGGPNAVGWDSDEWEWQPDDVITEKLPHKSGTGVRWLHVVPLRHKQAGKVVWVASTHLAHKSSSADIRADQARAVVHILRPLIKSGDPVFLGLDCNDWRTDSVSPKSILKAGGFKLLSEQKGVAGRNIESHHGLAKPSVNSRWIDEQCFANAEYIAGRQLDTYAKRLSDHNAQQGTYRLWRNS